MPTYEYQAVNAEGQTVAGRVFGASLDAAATDLSRRGLVVRQLGVAVATGDPLAQESPTPQRGLPAANGLPSVSSELPNQNQTPTPTGAEVPAEARVNMVYGDDGARAAPIDERNMEERSYIETSVWGPLIDRVPLQALAFFFRQGSTMLEAGVPMVHTMGTLAKQCRDGKLQRIITEMGTHVESGRPMSFGMQLYPEVFSPIMVSLTRAGETGGFLDEALGQVADYLDREIALRNLYKRITFYPKLQIGASIIIVMGANLIIASVDPGAQGLSSPLTTPATWIFLAPVIIFLFLFFRIGLANGGVKYFWDWLLARIPGMGKIMREFSMAKFGRAFGALYKGGIPLTQCVQMAADACGNEYLRSRMYPAVKILESGAGITETFQSTGAFSPLVIDMVQTGEMTGSLDKMLGKMAEFYEDEAATKSTQLAQITGVVLGLLVAIYIGFIVISFYTGYFGGVMKNA